MNSKNNILYKGLILLGLGLSFTACQGFLDKEPITKPQAKGFLSARQPIEDYCNALYISLPTYSTFGLGPLGKDKNSDNIVSENYDRRLNGELNINSGELLWKNYYQNLRSANYLLANYGIETDKETPETTSLLGEGFFFRAYWHFELLKNFGAVPIMDTWWDDRATLEGLQIPKQDRTAVAKFILKDLETAVEKLRPRSVYKGLRINKEAALVLAMNVALYEGSWEYYHKSDEFAAPTNESTYFLEKVLELGDQLKKLNPSLYTIENDKTGLAYAQLFNSQDLSDKPEVLLWRKYSIQQGSFHNLGGLLAAGVTDESGSAGITKGLVDNYLRADGTFIDPTSTEYRDFNTTFKDRDPRLLRTVMHEGCLFRDTTGGASKAMHLAEYTELPSVTPDESDTQAYVAYTKIVEANKRIAPPALNADGKSRSLTGYHIRLGINETFSTGNSSHAYPLIRYAEALLDYAEAAELLGKCTDEVLDQTLKPLQERAGVKYIKPTSLDPNFPNYGYTLTPIMQAIRRERRSELALQGARLNDLMRWKGENLIVGHRYLGAWLGDESLLLHSFPKQSRESILLRSLRNDQKYLDPLALQLPGGLQFNPHRDYLFPIPSEDIALNKAIGGNNPNW